MVGDEMGEQLVAVQFRVTEKLTGAALRKVFQQILEGGEKIRYHATSNEVSIHELAGGGGQTHGIEVTKAEMQGFDRYAKKYHVWYSMTREKNDGSKYLFLFQLKDFDRLENAMRDYFKDNRDHATLAEKIEKARDKAFQINQASAKEKAREPVKSKGRNRSVER